MTLTITSTDASVSIRANQLENSRVIVAIDFLLNSDEHITAPFDKGISMAPKIEWRGADVIDTVIISTPEKQFDSDGKYTGFQFYKDKLTILYKLKETDHLKGITCIGSYVVCSEFCKPKQIYEVLHIDGNVTQDEIDKFDNSDSEFNLLKLLIFALFGGLILNFMPCVFPIISIKVFSIMKMSNAESSFIRKHALMNVFGNISTFATLGLILSLANIAIPGQMGWGFYMQSSAFVYCVFLLFLFCALYFFGIFNFSFNTPYPKVKYKGAYIGSFLSGVAGALTSTVCVGPFTAVAVGGALFSSNPFYTILILSVMGVGLSFPFILLSIYPNVSKYFPKPGKWLELTKFIMGFAMLLSCVWLIGILADQTNVTIALTISVISILISMLAFLKENIGIAHIKKLFFVLIMACACYGYKTITNTDKEQIVEWIPYNDNELKNAIDSGKPIFLDFTASWCLNCQFNKTVLESREIEDIFKQKGVILIRCDWTKRDREISDLMAKYDSAAVPLCVYYPGNGAPYKKLNTMITKQELLDLLG
ncbi:MAG: thioredoxin family protein [Alphaproteobacteria bacterium]|nr:thioredoxin family protein [Alphaproteobacteria bacterium]